MNAIFFLDQIQLIFVFLESACYHTPIFIRNLFSIQARYLNLYMFRLSTVLTLNNFIAKICDWTIFQIIYGK
jgi:hypothetical protein